MSSKKLYLFGLIGACALLLQGCLFSEKVSDYRADIQNVQGPNGSDYNLLISTHLIKNPDEVLRSVYEKYEQGTVKYQAKACPEVDWKCESVPPLSENCFCGNQNKKGVECFKHGRDPYSLRCDLPRVYRQENIPFYLVVHQIGGEKPVFIERSPLLSAEILGKGLPARVEEQAEEDGQPPVADDGGAGPKEEGPAVVDVKDPLLDLAKAIQELEESKVGKNSGGCFSLANGDRTPTLDWLVVVMLVGIFGVWRLSAKLSGKFLSLFFVIISGLILNGCLSDKANDYQVTRQGQIVTKLDTGNLQNNTVQGAIANAKKEVCLYNIDGENSETCINICAIEKVNADWKLFCRTSDDAYPTDRRLQPNQLFRLRLSHTTDPRKAYSPYLTLNWLNNVRCEGGRGDRIANEFSEFRWNNGHLAIKGRFRICSPQWQEGSRIGAVVYQFITPDGVGIENEDNTYSCQTEYVTQRDGYFSCRFFPRHRGFTSVRLQADVRYEVSDPMGDPSVEADSRTIQLTSSAIDLTRYIPREFLVEAELGEDELAEGEEVAPPPAADDGDGGAVPEEEEGSAGDVKDPFPDLTKLLQAALADQEKANKKGGGCFSLANGDSAPTLDWLFIAMLVGVFGVWRLSAKLRDKTFRA